MKDKQDKEFKKIIKQLKPNALRDVLALARVLVENQRYKICPHCRRERLTLHRCHICGGFTCGNCARSYHTHVKIKKQVTP